jgi:hypothetical protein
VEQTAYETAQLDDADEMETRDTGSDDIQAQRAEIDRTRTDMAGTLDAIKDKLEPGLLMDQAKEHVTATASEVLQHAKETVHDVTSDVVSQAKDIPRATVDAAKHAVSGAVESARETMRPAVEAVGRVGGNVVDTVKSNPAPYAMIAIGLGWLYFNSRRNNGANYDAQAGYYDNRAGYGGPSYGGGDYGRSSYGGGYSSGYAGTGDQGRSGVRDTVSGAADNLRGRAGDMMSRAQDTAGQVAGRVQETAGQAATQVRQTADQAVDTFQQTLLTNPMAVGLVALALGVGVGMLVPETDRERQMMGQARDQVTGKVQQLASDIGQKAQTVARDTMDAAKQSLQDQGLAGAGQNSPAI